jgi:hypothetical protein
MTSSIDESGRLTTSSIDESGNCTWVRVGYIIYLSVELALPNMKYVGIECRWEYCSSLLYIGLYIGLDILYNNIKFT